MSERIQYDSGFIEIMETGINISGTIRLSDFSDFRDMSRILAEHSSKDVVIDISNLEFITSAGGMAISIYFLDLQSHGYDGARLVINPSRDQQCRIANNIVRAWNGVKVVDPDYKPWNPQP